MRFARDGRAVSKSDRDSAEKAEHVIDRGAVVAQRVGTIGPTLAAQQTGEAIAHGSQGL